MKSLAVVYALTEKYATALQLKNIASKLRGRGVNVKEIKQKFWPDFVIFRIALILKNVIKSLIMVGKDDDALVSASLLASSMPGLACKKLRGSGLVAHWDDSFEDLSKKKPHIWNLNY